MMQIDDFFKTISGDDVEKLRIDAIVISVRGFLLNIKDLVVFDT